MPVKEDVVAEDAVKGDAVTSLQPGDVLDRVTFAVERGKTREFARASFVTDPVHTDAAAAIAAGFDDLPATLTQSVAVGHARDQRAFVAALGLAIERVVVGSVAWRYERPLVAGDEFVATRHVDSDVTRAGGSGTVRVVTLVTEFADAGGSIALRVTETLIERGAA